METIWQIPQADPKDVARMSRQLGCHPVTAKILVSRGMVDPNQAKSFLAPSLSALRPPSEIKDIDVAAERLARAVVRKEKILVFGDYDADGISAAALLGEFLRSCGADVRAYLPHRIREGYGLQPHQVDRQALAKGVTLVVTADCGSASRPAISAARAAGVDVIVTDHHQVPEPVPEALAVVNPCRPDCPSGLTHLSGVGVSFYLLIAVRQQLRALDFWNGAPEPNLRQYCDLVALGTVADMVPLRRENRILVRTGLEVLSRTPRAGLAELMSVARIDPDFVDAEDLAFRIAPRINAAGRMAHAAAGLRLLTVNNETAARRIARLLDRLNRSRQKAESAVLEQALSQVDRRPGLRRQTGVVLSHPEWPEGILGIVASRLARRLYRPVVLISTRSGTGKGSARSIPGIDLYGTLSAVADCLDRFGGHTMAAGLALPEGRIGEFTERFEAAVGCGAGPDTFVRKLPIDAEISLAEISENLLGEIDALRPFGEGNPEPLLMARSVRVLSASPVGGAHLRLRLRGGGRVFNAIRFGAADAPPTSSLGRMAFRLRWNRWQGTRRLQLVVQATDADRE